VLREHSSRFKAPAARSRRLRRVQSRFAAFKVQGACGAFKAASRRSKKAAESCGTLIGKK